MVLIFGMRKQLPSLEGREDHSYNSQIWSLTPRSLLMVVAQALS